MTFVSLVRIEHRIRLWEMPKILQSAIPELTSCARGYSWRDFTDGLTVGLTDFNWGRTI